MESSELRLRMMQLPDEILIHLLSFFSIAGLQAISRTCKHLNELAEPYLYESVSIFSGSHAAALAPAMKSRPRRAKCVRSLLVSTTLNHHSGLECLPPILRNMQNLKILRLETPDCNSQKPDERVPWIDLQTRYERIFEQASILVPDPESRTLSRLEECTLHFVDRRSELYSLTQYASIFLHPTIKSLTISCMSTDYPDRLPESFRQDDRLKRVTALEHLHLEECDIFPPSLALLLSFPRELKSLKVSEGVRYDGMYRIGSRMHGNVRPDKFMDAVSKTCADTLERLSLSLGYRRQQGQRITDLGRHLNMTMMEKLKFVEIDKRTLGLIRVHPCDHETYRRLPPNLETFKVFGLHLGPSTPFEQRREAQVPLEPCFVKDRAIHGVPNLKTIIYSYDHYEQTNTEESDVSTFFTEAFLNDEFNDSDDQDEPDFQAGNHDPNPDEVTAPQAIPAAAAAAPINQITNHNIVTLLNNANFLQALNEEDPQPAIQLLRQYILRLSNRGHRNREADTSNNPRGHRFTQLEQNKITLLTFLNNEMLPLFRQVGVRLVVDLVKLPRGYIPPYLWLEMSPEVTEGWWDSDNARETESYKTEMKLEREAKTFQDEMTRERERERVRRRVAEEDREQPARQLNREGVQTSMRETTTLLHENPDIGVGWDNFNPTQQQEQEHMPSTIADDIFPLIPNQSPTSRLMPGTGAWPMVDMQMFEEEEEDDDDDEYVEEHEEEYVGGGTSTNSRDYNSLEVGEGSSRGSRQPLIHDEHDDDDEDQDYEDAHFDLARHI